MSSFQWVNATCPPSDAVSVGCDSAGRQTFVGRAIHECDVLAASIIPSEGTASVTYDGQEILKESFEFLTGLGFEWKVGENGAVPKYAVPTGTTAYGEIVFIAGVHHNGCFITGKLLPSHGCCYYPHDGYEKCSQSYEVLIQKPLKRWVPYNVNCSIMEDAVAGGQDVDGDKIYIGRAHFNDDLLPVCVIPEKRVAYVSFAGRAHKVHRCEVLCGDKWSWVADRSGGVPENAIEGGRTIYGEILYVGRVNHENCLIPGKIHQSYKCTFIPFNETEIGCISYEVLVMNEQ